MNLFELTKRAETLEKWLLDNIDAGNWQDVKNEYNNVMFKIQEFEFKRKATDLQKRQVAKQYHTVTMQQ